MGLRGAARDTTGNRPTSSCTMWSAASRSEESSNATATACKRGSAAAAVGITTATATAASMRIASTATMAASGPCACRGCNRQSSDARGEE